MTAREAADTADEATETMWRWLDGRAASPSDVRRAAIQLAARTGAAFRSVAETLTSGDTALDDVAASLAAMRGNAAIPRVVRMPQAERARAIGYLIAMGAGLDDELQRRAPDRELLERMLGLRSGHAGGLAEATDIGVDASDLALVHPDGRIASHVARSTDEELELARSLALFLVDWLPVLAPVMLAEFGAKGRAFEQLVLSAFADPQPQLLTMVVVGMIGVIAAGSVDPAELRRRQDELRAGALDLEMLQLLPKSDRQRVLAALPSRRQQLIETGVRHRARRASGLDGALHQRNAGPSLGPEWEAAEEALGPSTGETARETATPGFGD